MNDLTTKGSGAIEQTQSWTSILSKLRSRKLFVFLLVGLYFGGKSVWGAQSFEQEELGMTALLWSGVAYIAAQGLVDAVEAWRK